MPTTNCLVSLRFNDDSIKILHLASTVQYAVEYIDARLKVDNFDNDPVYLITQMDINVNLGPLGEHYPIIAIYQNGEYDIIEPRAYVHTDILEKYFKTRGERPKKLYSLYPKKDTEIYCGAACGYVVCAWSKQHAWALALQATEKKWHIDEIGIAHDSEPYGIVMTETR